MSFPPDIKRIMLRLRAKLNDRRNRDTPPAILRFEVESDIRAAGLGALARQAPRRRGLIYRRKEEQCGMSDAFVRYTLGREGHYRIKVTSLMDFSAFELAKAAIEHEMVEPSQLMLNASFRMLATDQGRSEIARLLMKARRDLRSAAAAIGNKLEKSDE